MAKQLNVNLAFTADTSQAKTQLQSLQNQLNSLVSGKNISGMGLGITSEIQKGINAAAQLKAQLMEATNVNTGNLDLSKFSQSLNQSGMTISKYAQQLSALGPAGEDAFLSLTRSISTAEAPLIRVNAKLSQLGVVLKNTVKWQISSSLIHGFIGGVQQAYGYAQDLNESLNNIRIVTGQNVDQMAKFADEANKAAKALNTSTMAYTNASLIYYQQGLDDDAVKERTNATIKMANVSRQSAETVSDQMTAIWNNFDDGTKKLEYYADVITALGAATASSSDEIAQGLEKFAAVSETVGLSYEYATAALATVTATTRQSADVVGTAFKTLFARIQDLELGKTLDDGTTLGAYSQALAAVGVNIKDANGQMKEMDVILSEMGAKWSTLSKDQQTALAQSVAGVRQYTQLMALMENWDFMEENLAIAEASTGTLNEQAEIYAESWEAASKRVKAASESLYQDLLDDDFFIGFLNHFEKFLTLIDKIIDSMGGLSGLLPGIVFLMTQLAGNKMVAGFNSLSNSMKNLTSSGRKEIENTRQQAWKAAERISVDRGTSAGAARGDALSQEASMQRTLYENAALLTKEELKTYQIRLDGIRAMQDANIKNAEQLDSIQQQNQALRDQIILKGQLEGTNIDKNALNQFERQNRDVGYVQAQSKDLESMIGDTTFKNLEKNFFALGEKLSPETQKRLERSGVFNRARDVFDIERQRIKNEENGNLSGRKVLTQEFTETFKNFIQEVQQILQNGIDETGKHTKANTNDLLKIAENQRKEGQLQYQQDINNENIEVRVKNLNRDIVTAVKNMKQFGSVAMSVIGGISQMAMGISSLSSAWSIWNDQLRDGEINLSSVLSLITSLSMGIPMVASGLNRIAQMKVSGNNSLIDVLGKKGLGAKFVSLSKGASATGEGLTAAAGGAMAFAAYIAIAVVAIAGLVYAFKKLHEARNKDSIAAERAADAAKKLAEKNQELKSSLNELENSLSAYDNAIEALNKCIKGSEAWNDALQKVNDSTYDLLEKYPDLLKMENLFNDEGQLNQEVLDNYLAQKRDAVNASQAASTMASAKSIQAQFISDQTDYSRQLAQNIASNRIDASGYEWEGYAANMVEDLISLANGPADEFYTALDEYAETLAFGSINQEEMSKQVKESAEEIRKLANASKAAEIAMDNASKTIARNILGPKASDDNVTNFAEDYQKEYDKNYQAVYNELTGWGISQTSSRNNNIVEEYWKKYQEATGTNFKLASNAVLGDDDNRSFQYLDENGQKVEISVEEMAEAIAAAQASQVAEEEIRKTLTEQLNGVKIIDGVSTGLLSSLTETMDLNHSVTKNAVIDLLSKANTLEEQEAAIKQLIGENDLANIAKLKSEAVEKYDLDLDDIEDQAKALETQFELTEEESVNLAIQNQRMNKGVETLSENFGKWNKALRATDKTSIDYINSVQEVTECISDLVGVSKDLELSEDFLKSEENLSLLQKAAKGNVKAINELGAAVGKDLIEQLELAQNIIDVSEDGLFKPRIISTSAFDNYKNTVVEGIDELQNKINNGSIKVGDSVSSMGESWVTALNDMALATNMSVDKMNNLLNALGLEANVTVTEQTITSKKPITRTQLENPEYDQYHNLIGYDMKTTTTGYDNVQEVIQVPQIGANGDPGTAKIKFVGNGSVAPSTKSKASKKSKAPNRSSTVQRYKEVDARLENNQDDIDRSYGKNQIAAIEKRNEILSDKIAEAEDYFKKDSEALAKAATAAGVQFEIVDDEITNYTSEMNRLHDQLEAAYAASDEDGAEVIQDKIDDLKDAIDQYDESRELLEDLNQELQDNNFKALETKLDFGIELAEKEIEKLEFKIELLGDSSAVLAENLANNFNIAGAIKNKIDSYAEAYKDLESGYATEKYSEAQYLEKSAEILSNLGQSILEYKNAADKALEDYNSSLDQSGEKVDNYRGRIESLNTTLDHLNTILELTGRSKDFDAIGEILEGQIQTSKDLMEISKRSYESYAQDEIRLKQLLDDAIASGSEDEIARAEEAYNNVIQMRNDAYDQMLSDTEAYLEAEKALIQNNMNALYDSLEETLTGGVDFDYLMDSWDKLNTRQEEYLTKTNQIYETNKLMRTASQALDKTDNQVAKQKFKNFINETQSLQENTKLSEYELKIQQAKYDLLLAEIALQDAQNAKATVRLTQDSEGNFGYVYTADQDAISSAQQEYEDAENALYNISLEGQQEYIEKYLQSLNTMYDEMKELDALYFDERTISEEEYYERREELLNNYFGEDGILTQYSDLYNVAVRTDAQATEDFWGTKYGNMTTQTGKWKEAVDGHLTSIEEELKNWREVTESEAGLAHGALDKVKTTVDEIKTSSELLEQYTTETLIPTMEEERKKAWEQVTAHQALYDNLKDNLIPQYEKMAEAINLVTEAIIAKKEAEGEEVETFGARGSVTGDDTSGGRGNVCSKCGKPLSECTCNKKSVDVNISGTTVHDTSAYWTNQVGGGRDVPTDTIDHYKKIKFASTKTGIIRKTSDGTFLSGPNFTAQTFDMYNTYETIEKILKDGQYYYKIKGMPKDLYYAESGLIAQLASGGYTGEWGPDGKLAMLHEKELVLNKDDTSNLLRTVSFIRDVVNTINSQASLSSLGSLFSMPGIFTSNSGTQQNIEIYAEFPNAVDHTEIETAFANLLNTASQYANRKP